MKRVTGIGGVFFKAENPKRLRDWYARHLGLPMKPFGSVVRWREFNDPEREGYTIWSPFPRDTKYFGEKSTDFMINFRVEDLDAVLRALRRERVRLEERVEELEYGRFAWIRDPEGNRVELWQPPARTPRPRKPTRTKNAKTRRRST